MTTLPPDSINIVTETDAYVVINKPNGLATQAPSGIDCAEMRVRNYLSSQSGESPYLGIPHRLDRPVSGVIVFAKTRRAARKLARQFQDRDVDKTYWALVEGRPDSPQGTWRDWMRKVPDEPRSEICSESAEGAQAAVLHYETVGETSGRTLLQIKLETGRSHQIRLQAGSRGLPVLGDQLYGSSVAFGPETEDLRKRWIALHARQLKFQDPDSSDLVSVEAPVPDDPAWKVP